MAEKMKVAWICHFSNEAVRKKLPLAKMVLFDFIRTSLVKKKKPLYSDFAPWVNNLIEEFERFSDIELHVIAPHIGLKKFIYEFELQGIHYHVFRPALLFMLDKIINKLFKIQQKEFRLNRFIVRKIIKNINPDIVNLIGTENTYYSITVLDIRDIPVFVSVQTVYTNPDRLKFSGSCLKINWDIELKIHRKEKYFGCGGRMHRDLILNNNPDAIIFKNFFPIKMPNKVLEVTKEYDFVFFAAVVTKKKGVEDAIDALALAKKQYPNITLNVVGSCSQDYKDSLNAKIATLNLSENISFDGYFPVHADMHQHVKKSKFALLPIKLDVIPGTIIEAMLLGLPVITYKTTGTPYLNKDGETVLMSDIGDTEKLAENMLKLLNLPGLDKKLSENAKAFVKKEFDNTTSAKRLLADYKAVINHYHHNKPIPAELLFDVKEFPVY